MENLKLSEKSCKLHFILNCYLLLLQIKVSITMVASNLVQDQKGGLNYVTSSSVPDKLKKFY